MRRATIEELRTWVITNDRTQEAAFELVRRLRELVPLLEDLQRRGEATGQEWAVSIAKKGLALAKGGEEKR